MPEVRLRVPDRDSEPSGSAPSDPLAQAESRLADGWIRPAVGGASIGFGAPAVEAEGGAQVHCTLLGVSPVSGARTVREPEPLRMVARYLVTASAATRAEADRLIVTLGFAAMATGKPELERDGPTGELWLALGVPARPALIVRETLEQPRSTPLIPLVRQPLRTSWSSSRTLVGRVIGPGGQPIAGARIDVANHPITTHANHRGEFALPGVPLGPPAPTLIVAARGVQVTVPMDAAVTEVLEIRLPLPE